VYADNVRSRYSLWPQHTCYKDVHKTEVNHEVQKWDTSMEFGEVTLKDRIKYNLEKHVGAIECESGN